MIKNLKQIYNDILKWNFSDIEQVHKISTLIHARDDSGSTLLHYAITDEKVNIVKY